MLPQAAGYWSAADEADVKTWDDIVRVLHERLDLLFIGSNDGLWLFVGAALVALVLSAVSNKLGLVAVVLTVGSIVARCWLVSEGYIYQAGRVRLVDLMLGAQVLVVVGLVANRRWPKLKSEQSVGILAAVLGLPVTAYTALQLVAPPIPADTELASCDGAITAGAKYIARTGGSGLNVRTGPGTSYPPVARLDAACSVGFDGYCVGEPVTDIYVDELADVRWLRLRHTDHYASAAQVTSLRADASLGNGPEAQCPEGLTEPGVTGDAVKERRSSTADVARFKATVENSLTLGLSLRYGTRDDLEKTLKLEQLGRVPKIVDDSGVVNVDLGVGFIDDNFPAADFVELAFVPCLAPIIPTHDGAALVRVNLASGKVKHLPWAEAIDASRLSQYACRIDPLLTAADIEDEFKKQEKALEKARKKASS